MMRPRDQRRRRRAMRLGPCRVGHLLPEDHPALDLEEEVEHERELEDCVEPALFGELRADGLLVVQDADDDRGAVLDAADVAPDIECDFTKASRSPVHSSVCVAGSSTRSIQAESNLNFINPIPTLRRSSCRYRKG